MNQKDCEFQLQQQFGQPLEPGAYVLFQAQVLKPESVVSPRALINLHYDLI